MRRDGSRVLGKGAITVEQFNELQFFLFFFASRDKKLNMTNLISQLSNSLQGAIDIFLFFFLSFFLFFFFFVVVVVLASTGKIKNMTVESICQTAQLSRPEVALGDICLSFFQFNTVLIA